MATVISTVEAAQVEKRAAFRNRYGDGGPDLVLHLGPKLCCKRLGELAAGVEEQWGGFDASQEV